jgi:methylenetetrahydrofolate reductase (NADPH)
VDKGNGLLDKLTRMRPGTLEYASITHKYNVDTVPHVLCGGFTKKKQSTDDCHYLGINNVMALRGDAMKDDNHFVPKRVEISFTMI